MTAPGKKLGLISQIPRYPAGYTVEDVLRTAFATLLSMREKMRKLEHAMGEDASRQTLAEYSEKLGIEIDELQKEITREAGEEFRPHRNLISPLKAQTAVLQRFRGVCPHGWDYCPIKCGRRESGVLMVMRAGPVKTSPSSASQRPAGRRTSRLSAPFSI